VVLLLAFAATNLTAWQGKSATFDEPLHLVAAWVQVHHDDFRCDPEDPPLWRYFAVAGTPASRLVTPTSGIVWDSMLRDRGVEGLYFKDAMYHTSGNDAVSVLAAARQRMILFGVLLGALVAAAAWRWGGPVAAIVACGAYCFDANFLAHASLMKNDVASALAFFASSLAMCGVGMRASLGRIGLLAAILSAALTIKFSGVLCLPTLVAGLLGRALLPQSWRVLRWNLETRRQRLAAAAAVLIACFSIGYFAIWACYGFRFSPGTDPAQQFDMLEMVSISRWHDMFAKFNAFILSPAQERAFDQTWHVGPVLQLGWWASDHHLLPQTYIEGFLFTYLTAPGRLAYLLGTSAMRGRWYYFPVVIAVKTPLATLIGLAIAAVYWIVWRPPRNRIWEIGSMALAPAIYLAVAMRSDLNLGIRHILPVYPYLFLLLGLTAADAARRNWRIAYGISALLLLGLIAETYAAYPDFIPFFNVAAGGWQNGPNLLGDSNVDWGQDLPALAAWQRAHPQYQLYLNYFGSADPRYFGIRYINLPGSLAPADQTASDGRQPIYALSGNTMHDPGLPAGAREFFNRLTSHPPVAVLGHCIYLYNPP
jgi:hypothetical protein